MLVGRPERAMRQGTADQLELLWIFGHHGGCHGMAETMAGDRMTEKTSANRIEQVCGRAISERVIFAIGSHEIRLASLEQCRPVVMQVL